MPINAHPEYISAEKKYLQASTEEEKLLAMEEMMRWMPGHKGAEALRADLRGRYKKLKEKIEERKKKKKQSASKPGIKKEGTQVVLLGLTNSGKSALLSRLTNAQPRISSLEFTTQQPGIGMLNLEGINFQIIDMPAVNHETFDQGTTNSTDILLIMITSIDEIDKILSFLDKTTGKRIILFNKIDLLNENERRRIGARLQSKRYNFCLISCKTQEGFDILKRKLIENSGVIRIYTKQPSKQKDEDPVIMRPDSTVGDLSKKVFHSTIKVKGARVTGPSSKFPNQKVGLQHILKDKDIVEFHTD
ncbi:MAG: 50S ribosome-binding GTPase [Candidatus Pacearchaeota archaeon]|nr:50S ribosome-binding GTPase [Candidatus Pacearchaeota archaeon]